MPPKIKVSKDAIREAACEIVRREGAGALSARAIADRLHCSTQPIFSNYASMEQLRQEVIAAADRLYQSYIARGMADPAIPPYKASGMAYIRFAREERELFRLLFMRDRSGEIITENREEIAGLIALIAANVGVDEETAYRFHLEMWLYVHGIATMVATGYLDWDQSTISALLTDAYLGLKARYQGQKGTP